MATRFLLINGVLQTGEIPSVVSFLESTSGVYTTSRTNNQSKLLFWDRHVVRLINSISILSETKPKLLGSISNQFTPKSSQSIHNLLNQSLQIGFDLALKNPTRFDNELAITALVRNNNNNDNDNGLLDVIVHIGFYLPPVFGINSARLAVAGFGRDLAHVKYSDWVRVRKGLEKMRPPNVTELLLTNDGNHILEGSITNFFVICQKENDEVELQTASINDGVELQTASINDGVLPGIIRQLVIEVCSEIGVLVREIAPSWSERDLWEEAFITSSLRILQHVEMIQAPLNFEDLSLKNTWKDLNWVSKSFKGPGHITTFIQEEIVRRAERESGLTIHT